MVDRMTEQARQEARREALENEQALYELGRRMLGDEDE